MPEAGEAEVAVIHHMLVPLDGSALAERVLPHLTAWARIDGPRVTLARVLEPPTAAGPTRSADPIEWQLARVAAGDYLARIRDRLARHAVASETRVFEGQPAGNLINFAHGHDVDLIVLTSHGQSGLSGWNLGSVGHKLLLHARVHLLLVRAFDTSTQDDAATRYRRVLVPLDGSKRAECTLPWALRLAEAHDATVILAHVAVPPRVCCQLPLPDDEAELVRGFDALNRRHAERYLTGLAAKGMHAGRDLQVRLVDGDDRAAALHELVEREDVDLVILSAHGATGSTRWPYGSTALNLLAYGTSPLLIVQDLPREDVAASVAERAARERAGHG